MSRDLSKVIRHLITLTGADPTKARIPRGKHRLNVHTQRVGDVRLITVAPAKGSIPRIDESALQQLCASADTVLLQGIIVALPPHDSLWLALAGARLQRQLSLPGNERNWDLFNKALAQAKNPANNQTLTDAWRVNLLEANYLAARSEEREDEDQGFGDAMKLLREAEDKYPDSANLLGSWSCCTSVSDIRRILIV